MKLPAGTYYVGDPCYMFPHNEEGIDGVSWSDICSIIPYRESLEVELVKGYGACFVNSTAFGDGTYPVWFNGKLIGSVGVDAGLIGIFPEALVNRSMEVCSERDCISSYVKVDFDDDFTAVYQNGNFSFFNSNDSVDVQTDEIIEDDEVYDEEG